MGFSKEERAERARKAGLASAAKRQAAKDAAAFQIAVDEPPVPGDAPAEAPAFEGRDTGEFLAPALSHDRVHPEPQAAPVPERPINWGQGRMAAKSLAEAMADEAPVIAVDEPEQPVGEVQHAVTVRGTDMGAGIVYCEGNMTFAISDIVRTYTTDIPGPGDEIVEYVGRRGLFHKKA